MGPANVVHSGSYQDTSRARLSGFRVRTSDVSTASSHRCISQIEDPNVVDSPGAKDLAELNNEFEVIASGALKC